ncbi:hypothetical protein WJX81_003423 [Elliptochloris bilobata]|uniref:Piezo non-specific cation channel cap domain-containing protein n=1 Tax=Elliptochloris bilobata TaxID=381761 RepID=A0AAW1RT58_9CHLO
MLASANALAVMHAGFLAVPAALFGVSLVPGLLNSAYAAMMIGSCLVTTLRLEPPVQTAVIPSSQAQHAAESWDAAVHYDLWSLSSHRHGATWLAIYLGPSCTDSTAPASTLHHLGQIREPAPALLEGPLSPTSPCFGARGVSGAIGSALGAEAAFPGARGAQGGAIMGGQGAVNSSPSRGWRSALERTSMQLQESLLGVPEGVLPMGDAIGQAVVASAQTLADISDERVVPVDYLVALIVLFLLMVLDRLFYTLGHCLGKGEQWLRLRCQVLDSAERPVNASAFHTAACPPTQQGPRLVAVLERVQGGIIGQDIYIARAEGELALEEELYWALINIYRSPAVMFELTAGSIARKKDV